MIVTQTSLPLLPTVHSAAFAELGVMPVLDLICAIGIALAEPLPTIGLMLFVGKYCGLETEGVLVYSTTGLLTVG